MKAELIACEVFYGGYDFLRGWNFTIERIIVPEANNLAITITDNQLYIFDEFKMDKTCKKIMDLEIDDALIHKVVEFLKQKAELKAQFQKFFTKIQT